MVQTLACHDFFSSHEQSIAIEPRTPQPDFPEHTHNFAEIVIVTGGRGTHILNGKPHHLHQGVVCYIKPSDHHAYANSEGLHLVNILYRSAYRFKYLHGIDNLLTDNRSNTDTRHECIQGDLSRRVNVLLSRLTEKATLSDLDKESLFLQLLIVLQQSRYAQYSGQIKGDNVSQLLHWLQINFAQKVDWAELAAQFSLTERTLFRQVKQYTQLSPQRYLLQLRLAEGYYQIRCSDKTVTSIAHACGFNDSAYFSTCFKNAFNLTPRQLRDCSVM